MRMAYPAILSPSENGYVVYVPDFNINTQGDDIANAIEMARDAIGIAGIDMEDDKKDIPKPSEIKTVAGENDSDIVTLVDIDFVEYRRQNDVRTVRRNVALPSWLDSEAKRSGVNVSAILQRALKQELNLVDRR